MAFSVTTWNVNSLRQRLGHLQRWAEEADSPDVICLQETKTVDEDFPADEIRALGYEHLLFIGQKSYNGVAILSRRPIADPQEGFSEGEADPQKRLVAATIEGVRVFNCYVPNGSELGSDKFFYKLRWLKRLRGELDRTCEPGSHVIVCGDMNIALDDASVWDPFAWEGRLLYSQDERNAIEEVMDWGLVDGFRLIHPFAATFSWWDYRGGGWSKNQGLRIDHHLISESLEDHLEDFVIHKDVRGWDQPSDHVPVVATFEL